MVVYLNGTLEGLVRMCTAVAGYPDRAGVVVSTRFAAGYGVCLLSHVLGPYERGCSDGRPQKSPRHWFPCHVAVPFGPLRVHGESYSLGQQLHQAGVESSPMTLQMLPEYWDWEMYLTE